MALRITEAADLEVNEIIAYYNAKALNLGWAFCEELDAELTAIAANPRRCGWIDDRFRRCRLRRFPYMIAYEPGPPLTQVLAVYHSSRDEAYWRSRAE